MNPKTKIGLVLFQLAVAIGWAVGVVWFYFMVASVGEPVSTMAVLSYWARLLVGPVLLLVGSLSLIPEGRHQRSMSAVAFIGSLAIVFQALRGIAPAVGESYQRGSYAFAVLLVGIVGVSILSAVTGYTLYRDVRLPNGAGGLA